MTRVSKSLSCLEKFERQIKLRLQYFDGLMNDYQDAVKNYYQNDKRPVPCSYCGTFCEQKTVFKKNPDGSPAIDGEGNRVTEEISVLKKPKRNEDLKNYYKCNREYAAAVMQDENRLECVALLKNFIKKCKPIFPDGFVGGVLPTYLPANIRSNLVWQETIKTVTDIIIKQEVSREYYLEEIPVSNFNDQNAEVGISCSDITDLSSILPKDSLKTQTKKETTPAKTETYKFNIPIYTTYIENNILEWFYDSTNIETNVEMAIDDINYNKQLNLYPVGKTTTKIIEIGKKDATIRCVDVCGRTQVIVTPGWKLMVRRTTRILDVQKNDRLIDSCKDDNAKII